MNQLTSRPGMPLVSNNPMNSLTCRECNHSLAVGDADCPSCGCRTPFCCSVCAKPLSSVSVGVAPSEKHPLGGFSESGHPLCHAHRMTRCHKCESLLPQNEMARHVVGQHVDRKLREGKPPRIEPVFGYFCRSCESHAATVPGNPPHWILGIVLLAMALGFAVFVLR